MKLTKEQRVYVAVLGLAVGGFAIDRLFLSESLSGPAGASAAEGQPIPDAAALVVDPQQRAQPGAPADAASNIAERLDSLRDQAAQPDAMAAVLSIPPSWFETPTPPGTTAPAPTPEKPAPTIQDKYKLTAVFAAKAGGYATVNKQKLRLGQQIDDLVLIELRGRQAIFERGSEKIILEMEIPTRDPKNERPASDRPAQENP